MPPTRWTPQLSRRGAHLRPRPRPQARSSTGPRSGHATAPSPSGLVEDVLARGRGHALYATRKAGKSLFLLAQVAASRHRRRPRHAVYLDYRMTEDDLYERLEAMGYGPDTDLSRLRYALLPSLPPLDTREGAQALVAILDQDSRASTPATTSSS